MNKVLIENLRRIRRLEFEIPSKKGVYVLTGANGAGKSTLLACLAAIGDEGAFTRFFAPDIVFSNAPPTDIYEDTKITYSSDDYATRAVCTRKNSSWRFDDEETAKKVLASFGYEEVVFAGGRIKRSVREGETFDVNKITPAPDFLRKDVSEIFDNELFKYLSSVESPATGETVYLVRGKFDDAEYFFSENNFSAGERSIIRLIRQINAMKPKSLLLIDEAEMALHPKARKNMMTCLGSYASKRDLVIIVSTQSASLIKITDPRNMLLIEQDESGDMGSFICRRNVYPAAILGEMAFAEEILPDTVLLVEDPEAAMLLEAIVAKLKELVPKDFPYCKILPVGGYMQVVILLDNLSRVLPPFVKQRAVLDGDAENIIRRTAAEPHYAKHEVVSRNMERIYFLPCAPEQGVIRLLESDPKKHASGLMKAFSSMAANLLDVLYGSKEYRELGKGTNRGECKDKLNLIVKYFCSVTGEPEVFVRRRFYAYYVEFGCADTERLKREYGPLIFKR